MQKQLLLLLLLCTCLFSRANDGVFYANGNVLVPVAETDISVAKEILTITVGEDDYALVDVYYEFMNGDSAKTVTMAFEAASPYNVEESFSKAGIHPYIHNFSVEMNGTTLPYSNAVVALRYDADNNRQKSEKINLAEWKSYKEVGNDDILPHEGLLYNASLDSILSYGYGYYFTAAFQPGKNTVHHTYRYHMSHNVVNRFTIPYWLTPATRWANHQIDDFTLRIKAPIGVGVCMEDSLFLGAPFTSSDGKGQIYRFERDRFYKNHFLLAYPNDSYVEWHMKDFRPTSDITITSDDEVMMADWSFPEDKVVVSDADGMEYRYVGETADSYFISAQDYGFVPKAGHHTTYYNAEKGQGWLVLRKSGAANVRKKSTTKSGIVCTIKDEEGYMPEAYPCLGFLHVKQPSGTYEQWYKLRVGKKTGYVRADLMGWSAVNKW